MEIVTLELPVPVAVHHVRFSVPPFLSVAPLVAPLALTVSPLPAVFAVCCRIIPNTHTPVPRTYIPFPST